jgi:hypothetical protein
MDTLLYLIYTHREYDDILQIQLKNIKLYLPDVQVAVCSNDIGYIKEKYGQLYTFYDLYEYDNEAVYGERLRSVLSKIPHKYVLFNHEINVLVSNVYTGLLPNLVTIMDTRDIDQLRLFVTGIENPIFNNEPLHRIEAGYFFSCNSAIWKTSSLLSIATKFSTVPFRLIENAPIQEYVSSMKNYYISSPQDFLCPGEGHYFCQLFPVIHITHGGKWRNSPFHNEYIQKFAKEFNIDLSKRGTCF